MKHDKIHNGQQLKAGRVMAGLTIDQLANKAGINRNSVIRAESSKHVEYRAYAVERIESALELYGVTFSKNNNSASVSIDYSR